MCALRQPGASEAVARNGGKERTPWPSQPLVVFGLMATAKCALREHDREHGMHTCGRVCVSVCVCVCGRPTGDATILPGRPIPNFAGRKSCQCYVVQGRVMAACARGPRTCRPFAASAAVHLSSARHQSTYRGRPHGAVRDGGGVEHVRSPYCGVCGNAVGRAICPIPAADRYLKGDEMMMALTRRSRTGVSRETSLALTWRYHTPHACTQLEQPMMR